MSKVAEQVLCQVLNNFSLTVQVTDDPSLWGGYLLGCYILDNSSVRLTVTEMLK